MELCTLESGLCKWGTIVSTDIHVACAGDIKGSPFQFWPGLLSLALVTGSTGAAAAGATASGWASARGVGGGSEPAREPAEGLTLLDLSMLAEEQVPDVDAAKPGPALQSYLETLAQAASAVDTVQRPRASCAMQQPAAPLHQTPAQVPVFGRRSATGPAHMQGLSAATTEPQEAGACMGNAAPAALATQAVWSAAAPEPATNASAARPVFASRKRPGMPASTAAPKPTAAKRGKEAPGARKPAASRQPMTAAAALGLAQPVTAAAPAGGIQRLPASAAPPQVPAAAAEKLPQCKRTKAGDLDATAVEAKVMAQHVARALDKLSMPEMKCALKVRKLPVGGKKADLIARLTEALEREE